MPFPRPIVVVLLTMLASCGGATSDGLSSPSPGSPSGTPPPSEGLGDGGTDAGTEDSPSEDASPPSNDGTATRQTCTSSFGNDLSATHGRLDGYLVSVVPESDHSCNGDPQHLHLQVKMNGAIYDVAVNVDGLEAEMDAPLPGEAWSEGWHTADDLDYVKDLGLHSPSFTLTGLSAVRQRVATAIGNANHVAVYTTGYGPTGGHLVHRQGSGRDGALVLNPLSTKPHIIAFCFETQTF